MARSPSLFFFDCCRDIMLTDHTDCTDFFAHATCFSTHGDDGFYGFCEHCMLTLLLARNVPVAKYVSTDYVVSYLSAATG